MAGMHSYEMQNEVLDCLGLPYYCNIKVHRLMCVELKKFVNRISKIFPAIESARPRCGSGIQALCKLHISLEKAELLVRHCSECSKLYLAFTGNKVELKCEKIRNDLELCLSQIQNMVPPPLASQISSIVDDIKIATFTVESSEDEAGRVIHALLRQDITSSESVNMEELKAFQVAALRLHITSPIAILIEKRSIRKLQEKIHDANPTKAKILGYFLYLVRKYGKYIGQHQTESIVTQNEEPLSQSIEPEWHGESQMEEAQTVFDTLEPPEEFKCPLSMRLMYDPVIIANGQTFERLWIEKWFNEGHETCPRTRTKLFDLSMTPNFAIKDLISRWCMERGIDALDPCSQPTFTPLHLQKLPSSSSIASFGSSLKGLHLQIRNVSLRSSDTYNVLNPLDADVDNEFGFDLPLMNADSDRFHSFVNNSRGINLSFLAKLASLPWELQCKAVGEVKNQLKGNQGSHSMISTSYIKPLMRFLKDAQDFCDSKAQKDGAQLLLTFLKECRSEIPRFHEDGIYMLSSLLGSEITEEALAIIELLSGQQYYSSQMVASGVLLFILRVLEDQISEFYLPAMKILGNLSSNSDIGHHMIYLDYIPKLAPFLVDRIVAGYCIQIFRNLCNIEEVGVAVAESDVCITSIAVLLESGTDEEQELAMDVLCSLCHQHVECCELVMKQSSIISSLFHIFVNGSTKAKLLTMNLLRLLKDSTEYHPEECPIPDAGLNLDVSEGSGNPTNQKKFSCKVSRLLGRKISIFSKPRC